MSGPTLETHAAATRSLGTSVGRYFRVTKPRIIELLLVTTVPSMMAAAGGWPGTWLATATLIGGTLCAASANTFNNVIDRDIDRVMARTSSRPTARDEITSRAGVLFATVLGIGGFAWLAGFVNLTAALLATSAILFYVFVYTLGMKRRTNQAVVIGGAAGCVPVLTGWAAVPGATLADPEPWLLFMIVFYWTPPHFWALAMKYRDEYAQARVPMLTVTHGNPETTRHILLYSYLLSAVVLMYAAAAEAGIAFWLAGVAPTVGFVALAHVLRRRRTTSDAIRLFAYSTLYLTLLFAAVAFDAVL